VVKLRLRRMGAKKRPSYRIVAAESSSPRDGRFIEAIGFYDPLTNPATITLKEDRVKHWLSVGAQPTETVRDIFVRHGLMERPASKYRPAEDSAAPA
jgi:small subunit ribosomal protein S16